MLKRIFKFIKESIFNIKPIFKIQIEESWFSNRWYCIKFSGNNGWKWEYILRSASDFNAGYPNAQLIEKECISYTDVVQFAQEFQTYEDCAQYNQRVIERVRKNNQVELDVYNKRRKRYTNAIEDFNKK